MMPSCSRTCSGIKTCRGTSLMLRAGISGCAGVAAEGITSMAGASGRAVAGGTVFSNAPSCLLLMLRPPFATQELLNSRHHNILNSLFHELWRQCRELQHHRALRHSGLGLLFRLQDKQLGAASRPSAVDTQRSSIDSEHAVR